MSQRIVVIGSPGVVGGASHRALAHAASVADDGAGRSPWCPPLRPAPPGRSSLAPRLRLPDPPPGIRGCSGAEPAAWAACRGFLQSDVFALGAGAAAEGMALVWAGCMNWLFPGRATALSPLGPDGCLYLSKAGTSCGGSCPDWLPGGGVAGSVPLDSRRVFPGRVPVLDFAAARLTSRWSSGKRLCRPSADQFPRDFFGGFSRRVDRPILLRVMGWTAATLQRLLGPPPPWADVLPPAAVPAQAFLASLHAMVRPSAAQRWKTGRGWVWKAMAACGVPSDRPGTSAVGRR